MNPFVRWNCNVCAIGRNEVKVEMFVLLLEIDVVSDLHRRIFRIVSNNLALDIDFMKFLRVVKGFARDPNRVSFFWDLTEISIFVGYTFVRKCRLIANGISEFTRWRHLDLVDAIKVITAMLTSSKQPSWGRTANQVATTRICQQRIADSTRRGRLGVRSVLGFLSHLDVGCALVISKENRK